MLRLLIIFHFRDESMFTCHNQSDKATWDKIIIRREFCNENAKVGKECDGDYLCKFRPR